ncbi:Clan CD, family C14, metacaspase-like cysteine peptidase [Tritrichomonas foetus]|uniref:Clan CD, family C14, metacaspase-like cysteine peptidase n=1 Tax=Tritrichomonas foetus TaxID=1144522 RepID=A0A1J4K9S0_9EUKA|nr:Clan CD, family C14, metacaspase-like cysteine peptidase [Tritrichomonas foetus]|eukprot:OHT07656.1 Clan CD, family C14, metacaspase-like cysteine peptidase [Tritrichomonas foetus]
MGTAQSKTDPPPRTLLHQFGCTIDIDDFQHKRCGVADSAITKDILTFCTHLHGSPEINLEGKRVALIICNTYTSSKYQLGTGPLSDSFTAAAYLKELNFAVYFARNPTRKEYKEYIKLFFEAKAENIFIYYTGHSETVSAGSEEDAGKDESLIFEDGPLMDEELAELISKSKKDENSVITMLNECCHSGNTWNIKGTAFSSYTMPKKLILISSIRANSTTPSSVGSKDHGLFSFYFFRLVNDNQGITYPKLESEINHYLAKHQQYIIKFSTTPELLNGEVLPKYEVPK